MKKISIVVPMYNEIEAAPFFFEAIEKVINVCPNYEFEIVAVNDGSKDDTLKYLLEKQKSFKGLVVVDLSRNWGHESAVLAGLKEASGDAIIPIDADLQDPPEIIPQMIELWETGYQVVNAQRASRNKDTSFKKNTAGIYYKILNNMSGKVRIPDNVANFRLVDRQVLDSVLALPEKDRVFRIEVPFVGYKTGVVQFDRAERVKGKSKYNFSAMYNLAVSSVLNVTTEPLRWSIITTVFFGVSFLLSGLTELILFIVSRFVDIAISPLSFAIWLVVNVLLFISIFVFFTLGVISLYLAQNVTESRGRPTVIVNKVYRK